MRKAHQESKQIKKDVFAVVDPHGITAVRKYKTNWLLKVMTEAKFQRLSMNWRSKAGKMILRYAESYARMRSQKGFGPVRIAYELRQQGIETRIPLIKVLQATTERLDWLNLMEQVYTKKYPESACNRQQRTC